MTPFRFSRHRCWHVDYIALSIPVFFVLMGVEWLISRRRGLSVYRFADWVGNLGCGIIQQTFKVVLALFVFVAYRFLYEHRLFEFPMGSVWTWVLCFVGWDFCYYWFHRLSHELNFLWAAHVVHHQSEEYNLGVALRQSALQSAFSWVFYLPLAILGFPPLVFIAIASINQLYQFWLHTQLIHRMGPFEWIFNTPSHHRVHHGQNPEYIDRNHGGTLIVWDRLFGTFEPERASVIYGVTEPPNSWNPLFDNFHHWALSVRRTLEAKTWTDRTAVWLKPPGFVPEGVVDAARRVDPLSKYDTPVSKPMTIYVAVQFGVLAASTTAYLFFRSLVELEVLVVWGVSIIATAALLGSLLDGARWAKPLEMLRPLLIAGAIVAIAPAVFWAPGPLLGLAAVAAFSALGFRWALQSGFERTRSTERSLPTV